MKLEELLRTHDFTKGLAQSQIATLAALATEVHFDEGQLLLFGGGLSEYLYLLISGSVEVELTAPQLTLTVQVLGPGQAFGWSGVLECQHSFFQDRFELTTWALPSTSIGAGDDFNCGLTLSKGRTGWTGVSKTAPQYRPILSGPYAWFGTSKVL